MLEVAFDVQQIADQQGDGSADKVSYLTLDVIPARFWNCRLENPELKSWADECLNLFLPKRYSSHLAGLDGLLLVGPTGVGKTGNLWALYRYLAERGFMDDLDDFQIYRTVTMLACLRPGDDDDDDDRITVKQLIRAPLLALDDIGSHKSSEWTEERLYEIVDSRYEECRPTIFTTNLPVIAKAVGDRIASRIAEMCRVVVLKGDDRRRSRP